MTAYTNEERDLFEVPFFMSEYRGFQKFVVRYVVKQPRSRINAGFIINAFLINRRFIFIHSCPLRTKKLGFMRVL